MSVPVRSTGTKCPSPRGGVGVEAIFGVLTPKKDLFASTVYGFTRSQKIYN